MKFKKGDKVIVLDETHTPHEWIERKVTIIFANENSKTYWCQDKWFKRYWLNEFSIELVSTHKRKERLKRRIEKLQTKLKKLR